MTLPTGKRASRACLRCRRRKTKCNLDGIGEPKKPPCESCHQAQADCVLVQSQRGQTASRSRRRPPSQLSPAADQPLAAGERTQVASNTDHVISDDYVHTPMGTESFEPLSSDENMHFELRNPSDALQILAQTGNISRDRPLFRDQQHTPEPGPEVDIPTERPPIFRESASVAGHASAQLHSERHSGEDTNPTTVLDDYELVQRGLIHPAVLPELLYIYTKNYHPYCPIVPTYMLGPQAMTKIRRSDYFLLTVILAIASRDSSKHALSHRYCWDHAQRLILEVVMAHVWAHTSRTVQALLLLAEWLPYQMRLRRAEVPRNLLREDRTVWSFVGLAVRQGYLLRLDRAAFRGVADVASEQAEEEKRLLWTFIYLADRQISVRMGQSFWSRGPSLSSKFTARDFPSLGASPGWENEDYASLLQANMDLTQILYNAHGIMYSSTERTLAMVHDGDYARYLDDFQRATTNWRARWRDIKLSQKLQTTLHLLYEYVCLYVNAFSFHAVLSRASSPRSHCQTGHVAEGQPLNALFSRGLMSSPDGPYIYEAIGAARKALELISGFSPAEVLRHLPTRYYLYGIYAAVFLHKVQNAGAFQSASQKKDIFDAASRFVYALEQASPDESHTCRRYSGMLKSLWGVRSASPNGSQRWPQDFTSTHSDADNHGASTAGTERVADDVRDSRTSTMPWPLEPQSRGQFNDMQHWASGAVSLDTLEDPVHFASSMASLPSLDGYLNGSFFPGITGIDYPIGVEGATEW